MESVIKETPSEVPPNDAPLKEAAVEQSASNDVPDQEKAGEEYAYLERNEFTSEIYKIEVKNMGYFGIGEFKKLLKNTLKLDMTKIKSPTRKEFAFVCFRTQEDQQRALETLNGYKWKGRVLKALAAKASADPLQKKRAAEGATDSKPKRQRTAVEATCPLAGITYDEQLKQKSEEMSTLLKKYTQELRKINPQAKPHLDSFKFNEVLPSPTVNGYRNKNEFTVGKNSAGEVVVGFRLGSYSDGSVEVAEVQDLPHLPDQAKWAAQSFQKLVRQSKFQPFNPDGNVGHFRQLMVRCSSATGELMLVAGIYSSNLSEDEQQELKQELKSFYEHASEQDDATFKCTSLYYQDVKHREAGQMVNPVDHILGTTHITDTIQGLQFRISPLAFFQINTEGANVLYQQAIDLVAPTKNTTMLDICCGTGTIALAFAKHCKRVLGVEIVPDAIKDAQFNAEANGIKNCKFFTGNADDFIKSMVREAMYEQEPGKPVDLIAVVDPPRAGLHNRSIAAIRSASAINRLVYVSCNPHSAKRNFIELARPESKHYKGEPFYPKSAVAVDMFPHTTHTELVILFEREAKTKTDENAPPAAAAEATDAVEATTESLKTEAKTNANIETNTADAAVDTETGTLPIA
ncbi:tRNA (uracil-5-)-methyltransferase homolog A [Drosophila persimilis]|uniref:tRNA (uracil-5-)-methyltransferase homolog A n=1 Tax=Drosophila persimilis TaxID=7234 RepID=UPI000F08E990|nr:tRNA (uracil-5-)-methyltransferase homolog A [Drosophila persimilis]